jgi:hypothetical protein
MQRAPSQWSVFLGGVGFGALVTGLVAGGIERVSLPSTSTPKSISQSSLPTSPAPFPLPICAVAPHRSSSNEPPIDQLDQPATAKTFQLQLSTVNHPHSQPSEPTVNHPHFVSLIDLRSRQPRYVLEHLTPALLQEQNEDRAGHTFHGDPSVPAVFRAVNGDYLRSGWSRGHLCPAGNSR